jgi:hypothetical protein
MRVKFAYLATLSIAILLGLSIPNLAAQDKAAKKAEKATNIQGMVKVMSKDASTITVQVGTGTSTRKVMYDAKTKFLYGHSNDNKPGAVAQVKELNFISCSGTFDAKDQFMATECIYREKK